MSQLSQEIHALSLQELARLIQSRAVSPVEVTQVCLDRIQQFSKLNAFISVLADSALAQASEAEKMVQKGRWLGPLHGIPIALKDVFDTAGIPTTAASELFKDRIPERDAEVVRRLRGAGAVVLGKLNMHEFAYGASSVVSYFGDTPNPWNLKYISGGSSSGSASAVAAELCYAALGSDTGGSIRQPAACCGVVGLKPTYGRVSTRGVIPLSWSLDHIGPITRTVADAALVLQGIAGYDPEDPNSADVPVADYSAALGTDISGLRLGIPTGDFYRNLDPEIEQSINTAISVLNARGAGLRKIELPAIDSRPLLAIEAYAYHEEYVRTSAHLYQPETLRRIREGASIQAAEYIRGRRELELARRSAGRVFEDVDVLVTPTVPRLTPMIQDLTTDRLRAIELEMLRNTRPFNALGLPGISVPCGFANSGLPIGMQIVGPANSEATILAMAHAYENATEWHKSRPKLEAHSGS